MIAKIQVSIKNRTDYKADFDHGKDITIGGITINNQIYFGLPEEDPSYYLPGYTFVGWKIDGVSGTPRSYMLPKGSYGNRTATMLWEPIP